MQVETAFFLQMRHTWAKHASCTKRYINEAGISGCLGFIHHQAVNILLYSRWALVYYNT